MAQLAIEATNEASALRSLVYASFAAAFDYPDAPMLDAVRSGAFAAALKQLLEAVDPGLGGKVDWGALRDAGGSDDDLLAEYTRLFIAGNEGPACALEEGVHLRTSHDAMEESLRFYKFFGLSLPEDRQEQPDHLRTELEFLHYLTFQEAGAAAGDADVAGVRRAQRDFIDRHPGAWVPLVRDKLADSGAMPFFVELAKALALYLEAESRRLGEAIGPPVAESEQRGHVVTGEATAHQAPGRARS